MAEYLGVNEAARELGVRPRDISDAFYAGHLTERHGFIVSGRRLILRGKLPEVRRVLVERGKLSGEARPIV